MCPVGAELLQADGRTDRQIDMTNRLVTFRNFKNTSKNMCKVQSTAVLTKNVMMMSYVYIF